MYVWHGMNNSEFLQEEAVINKAQRAYVRLFLSSYLIYQEKTQSLYILFFLEHK